ncbi:MAG: amino acid permease [Acidobacteria bacterium]|jgi:amino acid transporter|nr:amino acid permease [Acidobacteriota bacterium]HRU09067.1 APC family permease [Thermoanaerobaculia bacterium]
MTVSAPPTAPVSLRQRASRTVFGAPKDPTDRGVFHRMSLVAFLAWVGLGADGLTSSSYGPEEAFRALGAHTYLALALAAATAFTVWLLSASYRSVIEHFPTGGGYVVASHLLGPRLGLVSGAALVVDYVLTSAVSIASGGNALFSFLPADWAAWKLPLEVAMIALLMVLNLRGVKESVSALLPVFLLFLATHVLLIGWAVASHLGDAPTVAAELRSSFDQGLATIGTGGMVLLFLRAYSLGGGTYTGIEAVSNGLQIMREPRVQTGKRTMTYMAVSLAFTAGGILVAYLLLKVVPVPGKTLNAVLAEATFGGWRLGGLPLGAWLVPLTLLSEGLLLFVAAQAGFIAGPRVMANMAIDSFLPHRFAALSERLTMHNGVLVMGSAALALLFYTEGNIHLLVVMYSINVFLTFTLSQAGMSRFWWQRRDLAERRRHLALHGLALAMCASILGITLVEKFRHGGWLTVTLTSVLVILCLGIHAHYGRAKTGLRQLDEILGSLPTGGRPNREPLDPTAPTALILVRSFDGLGVHLLLSVLRTFPGLYRQFVFVGIAVVDSGSFKGRQEIESLQAATRTDLERYVALTRRLGFAADFATATGIDVVEEGTALTTELARRYPRATVMAGKLVFRRERWFHGLLHNETSAAIQRRLQWLGVPMVILPVRAST